MTDLKNESRENSLRKSFAELINTIMFDDECYPEPELLEGGTRLIGTTVLIRLKSLERVYLKYPQKIEAYLKSNNLPEAVTVCFLPAPGVAVALKGTAFLTLSFFDQTETIS